MSNCWGAKRGGGGAAGSVPSAPGKETEKLAFPVRWVGYRTESYWRLSSVAGPLPRARIHAYMHTIPKSVPKGQVTVSNRNTRGVQNSGNIRKITIPVEDFYLFI